MLKMYRLSEEAIRLLAEVKKQMSEIVGRKLTYKEVMDELIDNHVPEEEERGDILHKIKDVLNIAYKIAKRKGENTDWCDLEKSVKNSLFELDRLIVCQNLKGTQQEEEDGANG
jgi:hypothetical protein